MTDDAEGGKTVVLDHSFGHADPPVEFGRMVANNSVPINVLL